MSDIELSVRVWVMVCVKFLDKFASKFTLWFVSSLPDIWLSAWYVSWFGVSFTSLVGSSSNSRIEPWAEPGSALFLICTVQTCNLNEAYLLYFWFTVNTLQAWLKVAERFPEAIRW